MVCRRPGHGDRLGDLPALRASAAARRAKGFATGRPPGVSRRRGPPSRPAGLAGGGRSGRRGGRFRPHAESRLARGAGLCRRIGRGVRAAGGHGERTRRCDAPIHARHPALSRAPGPGESPPAEQPHAAAPALARAGHVPHGEPVPRAADLAHAACLFQQPEPAQRDPVRHPARSARGRGRAGPLIESAGAG